MPRCLHCNNKFEKRYPKQQGELRYCLNTDECTSAFWNAVKEQRIKQAKREKAKRNKELETVQDLMKKAQKAFNSYIRHRDKDKPCISCGKPLRKGNTDCGHFWSSGGHKFLTFHEDNCHAQCSRPCNKDKSGDLLNYRIGLIERIGKDRVQWLDDNRNKIANYTREELRQIEQEYKQKLKDLTTHPD